MAVIERLPDDLANQIAAGEVVERPSSVVKELLENSLDAGATRLRIDVEGGGIGLLRIADDGTGMAEEDALLAIERHATSKLRRFEDLGDLYTFGFRGEALPSIASVSRFTLLTRQRDDEAGVELKLTGGGLPEVRPCGMAPGTIIEVRDLFFNVPARRKFLKAVSTESAHITDVVEALALAAPTLTVTLAREGRIVREWLRSDTRAARVQATFKGEELAQLDGSQGPLQVEAHLARPERARAASTALRLFVNGRLVRDRTLLRTVSLAYGSVLPPGRFPIGAVFVELPPSLVDVNVHPQKAEVRFADGRAVGDAMFQILSLELARAFGLAPAQHRYTPHAPPVQPNPAVADNSVWGLLHPPGTLGSSSPQIAFPTGFTQPGHAANPSADTPSGAPPPSAPTLTSAGEKPGELPADPPADQDDPWGLTPSGSRTTSGSSGDVRPALDPAAILYGPSPGWPSGGTPRPGGVGAHDRVDPSRAGAGAAAGSSTDGAATPGSNAGWGVSEASSTFAPGATAGPNVGSSGGVNPSAVTTRGPSLGFAALRFVAQLRQMFLVCEGEQGMVIMDQHAAAERVTFHRLKKAFSSRTIAIQPLLFPVLVEVSGEESAFVEEQHDLLLAAGVEARSVGPRTVAVHGTPQILRRGDPERLLRDLLDEASRAGGRAFSDAIDMALATMACHGSVRAGDTVSPEEAAALLRALDDCDFAGHCPHGRPIVTTLRWDELERKVGRG